MENKKLRALIPGSFDPVTNGHLDVIRRASQLFNKTFVAIAKNMEKNPLFTVEERISHLEHACQKFGNIEIVMFEGLLTDAVKTFNAAAVVRGLRAVSDFEYEFQMALMNRELEAECETIFLMPSPKYSFVSSRMIKEIALYDGDVSAFVPEEIASELKKRIVQ